MNEYIKGFNDPWLKVETQGRIRVININEIRCIDIDKIVDRAWIVYKGNREDEILTELGYAISNFLMTIHKQVVTHMDVDLAYENQTMSEWMEENGQK